MLNFYAFQIDNTGRNMTITQKKHILFYAAVALMFMTSMNKVLVPNTVFDELQGELGISGQMLAAMGAGFSRP